MKRRDALKTAGLLLGYTMTAGTAVAVMNGCNADSAPEGWAPSFLDMDQVETIKAISNVVIPSVDGKPGAKDVMIEKFFDERIDLYSTAEEKEQYKKMFSDFASMVKDKTGKKFSALSEEEQLEMVRSELAAGSDFMKGVHEMAVTGFCTSERGMKEVLVFDPIPGEQNGCIPFEEVGGIWAIS
jgi:hypothetical protein